MATKTRTSRRDATPWFPTFESIQQNLGQWLLFILEEMGRIAIFAAVTIMRIFIHPPRIRHVVHQIHFIGFRSLFVVGLTGLFTGMVLGIQGYYTLVKVGSEGVLGLMVALSLTRELGPVLTGLMVTGRAGSSMAAELGIMRISEQIDALDTMDIDPIRFLVCPRVVASVFSFPLLTAICNVVGIFGGYVTGVWLLGINSGIFLGRMEMGVVMDDITGGLIKSLFFALIVSIICCYQGYMTHLREQGFGARGVSYSTTTAVVMASVMILISDYVLTSFLI